MPDEQFRIIYNFMLATLTKNKSPTGQVPTIRQTVAFVKKQVLDSKDNPAFHNQR